MRRKGVGGNFAARGGELVCPVYLVYLVFLVYLVSLVHLVFFGSVNETNQINQTNQIDPPSDGHLLIPDHRTAPQG
jgi:hypothetical protein